VMQAIERAFKMWSDVSSLTFRETPEARGNLNIEFSVAAHSDGPQNAFDGPGKNATVTDVLVV
jgi:Matrixin